MKIAVLGAGGLGCAVAIELSEAGYDVALFEARDTLCVGASLVNEGKIHLGLIYAKDNPDLTARIMVDGALDFRRFLNRWIDADEAIRKSTPFVYAVQKGSQLTGEQIGAHFKRCREIFGELAGDGKRDYLGARDPLVFEELSQTEIGDLLDSDAYLTAFQTNEYAVDPRVIRNALVDAVQAQPRVSIHCGHRVTQVAPRRNGKFDITFENGRVDGPFDQVVNATWEGRMEIDAGLGIHPPREWSLRHKFGHRVTVRLNACDLPSVTSVLGAYGDIVNFGEEGFFLSWYPVGMVEMTRNKSLARNWFDWSHEDRMDVFRKSVAHWRVFCPKLDTLDFCESDVDPASGVIFALGDTDIDDDHSLLHLRNELGIQSAGGYHSVNTGKYTLIPQMAMRVADRVLGRATPGLGVLPVGEPKGSQADTEGSRIVAKSDICR